MTAEQGPADYAPEPAPPYQCCAVCRQCQTATPFGSSLERDRWAEDHEASRDHEVKPMDGWPGPTVAFVLAFGRDL